MTSYVVNIEILGVIIPLCASVRDRSIYASNVGILRTRSSMGVALKEQLAVALASATWAGVRTLVDKLYIFT